MKAGFAWECSCGHIEYDDMTPEECQKCGALDSFLKMPEEIMKAREQDMLEEEIEVSKVKTKTVKTKSTRSKKK